MIASVTISTPDQLGYLLFALEAAELLARSGKGKPISRKIIVMAQDDVGYQILDHLPSVEFLFADLREGYQAGIEAAGTGWACSVAPQVLPAPTLSVEGLEDGFRYSMPARCLPRSEYDGYLSNMASGYPDINSEACSYQGFELFHTGHKATESRQLPGYCLHLGRPGATDEY